MSQSQEVERLRALVDSLTGERDEAREQNRLATIDWANTAAELEAAEAEVKRLREVVTLYHEALLRTDQGWRATQITDTPPSERGDSA